LVQAAALKLQEFQCFSGKLNPFDPKTVFLCNWSARKGSKVFVEHFCVRSETREKLDFESSTFSPRLIALIKI
jgi:hypothetical protein